MKAASTWLAPALLMTCMISQLRAQVSDEKMLRFSFGTPISVTRAGFTKVTAKDAFTAEKAYGFESTQGRLPFDRGGSLIERPKDEYAASVYGAYRTTWSVTSSASTGQIQVALLAGERVIVEQTRNAETGPLRGTFDSGKLQPGIYTVRATIGSPQSPQQTAQRQIILCPDPFAW